MRKKCVIDDCTSTVVARGWCNRHYQRWRKTGDPLGLTRRPLEERLWPKVDKNGPVPAAKPELGPCWLFTGTHSGSGYGNISHQNRGVYAHRAAYELLVGPIPLGFELDHLCRVRHCVNPRHLEPVTRTENILRGEGACAKNSRKTHCINGHPFDEVNTRWRPNGQRTCRACERSTGLRATRKYRAKRRNAA